MGSSLSSVSKVNRHVKSPLGHFPLVTKRFDEIHIDLVGPLVVSENQRYCLTIIDRFTRWTEAIPLPDMRAETVAFALYSGWICRYGTPSFVITDQGRQFESELFSELANLFAFKRKRSNPYNPQANGFLKYNVKIGR